MLDIQQFFYIDNLSLVMMSLVGFVGVVLASFSSRYLNGDRKKGAFFCNLTALLLSVFVMVSADHILLLLTSWFASNYILSQLMMHKYEWEAAKQSSKLALKNFGLGLAFLGSSFLILYLVTGQTSIQSILNTSIESPWIAVSAVLLLLAAMTQSALWPFQGWLISSLNSPTPVSAIMHAGLINGGGFLLVRFSPLLLKQPIVLNLIFVAGIVTSLLGTLWMLMQHDIKRTLACSTMGQMGFMVAQCGLGLFPAAAAHLCWHGLFKAFLFLDSGSTAQKKHLDLSYPPSLIHLFLALICGVFGGFMFAVTSGKSIFVLDTSLFLILLAIVAGTQFALPIVSSQSNIRTLFSLPATLCMGSLYGLSVSLIEHALLPLGIDHPQVFNSIHLVAFFVLVGSWLCMLFVHQKKRKHYPDWMLKMYVYMLNASQPHPKTITAHRNNYRY